MNTYQILAKSNRKEFNRRRKAFHKRLRTFPTSFEIAEIDTLADLLPIGEDPTRVYVSRYFLVRLYEDWVGRGTDHEEWYMRMTVSRMRLTDAGGWVDGIRWEELQAIKSKLGFGEFWAVEVFPPDAHLFDDAAERHLFITKQPAFAWKKKPLTIAPLSLVPAEESPAPIEDEEEPLPPYDPKRCTCHLPPGSPSAPCSYCESGEYDPETV